jgi:hypothetical protein
MPSPAVSPTAPPTAPSGLKTRFRTERDGIRVTIELDRNPLPAGKQTWATMTVKNVGKGDVTWFHDGCAIAVGLQAKLVDVEWRKGKEHAGQSATFKSDLIRDIPEGVWISFAPEWNIGKGSIGCADLGMSDTIHAGRSIKQRAQWDGMAYLRLGMPPSGRASLHGWAGYYYRGKHRPANMLETGVIKVGGEVWIADGKDPSWLDPPEVIDAALADPEFVQWIAKLELGNGNQEILWFDLDLGLWQVGTLHYGLKQLHYLLVDPVTGEVVDTVERPWVPDVDGYP